MSDQTTVAAPTPENSTPQVQPEGQTTEPQSAPQAEGPQGPSEQELAGLSPKERAKARMRARYEAPAADAARTETQDPVVDATGRKHDPATGKFVAETGDPNPPAATSGTEGHSEAETAAERRERARIDLPEALRQQGKDFIEVDPEIADFVRAGFNGYTRRAEVEQTQAQLAEAQKNLMRLQAEQEVRSKMFSGPEYQQAMAKINAVREVDPEFAALAELALEQKVTKEAEARFNDLSRQQWGQQVKDAGDRTEAQAWQMATSRYPLDWLNSPAGRQVWTTATQMYVAEVQQSLRPGDAPQFNPQRIVEIADFYALKDPALRSHLTAQLAKEQEAKLNAEREKIRQEQEAEAKRREAEQLQQTAQRRSTMHPMGRIASQVRTDRQSVVAEPTIESVPAHERKRFIKQQLFGAGARK